MAEQVLELVKSLVSEGRAQSPMLECLCRAACQRLDARLKAGMSPEDCGDAYLTAAVWLVLSGLDAGSAAEGVKKFSAGDLTVERESGGGDRLEARAWALMKPYLRDDGFVFRGVPG